MTVLEKLALIQDELKAPKSQFNKFAGYHYRNQEDILEAVKPLLKKYGVVMTVSDEIKQIGDRYYVMATAGIRDLETGQLVSTSAFAREDQEKKGMDLSQLTGATSSYARKYALNGLFLIDDTEDADSKDNRVVQTPSVAPIKPVAPLQTPKVETVSQAPVSPLANEINGHMKSYETFDGGLPKAPTFNCADCNAVVTEKVFKFSSERLGRPMCFNCQNKAKGTN